MQGYGALGKAVLEKHLHQLPDRVVLCHPIPQKFVKQIGGIPIEAAEAAAAGGPPIGAAGAAGRSNAAAWARATRSLLHVEVRRRVEAEVCVDIDSAQHGQIIRRVDIPSAKEVGQMILCVLPAAHRRHDEVLCSVFYENAVSLTGCTADEQLPVFARSRWTDLRVRETDHVAADAQSIKQNSWNLRLRFRQAHSPKQESLPKHNL